MRSSLSAYASERKVPEIARRRADDEVPLRLHFKLGEAALHQSLRREAEQPVDPGEAAGVEDRLMREGRVAAGLRQHRGERGGIEGERGQAWRHMAVGRLEPALELAPKLGRRGGEPAAD